MLNCPRINKKHQWTNITLKKLFSK
jgi:hypothetical protein